MATPPRSASTLTGLTANTAAAATVTMAQDPNTAAPASSSASTATDNAPNTNANANADDDDENAFHWRWEVTRGPHAGEIAILRPPAPPPSPLSSADADVAPSSSSSPPPPPPPPPLGIGRHASSWLRLRRDLEVSGRHAELRIEVTTTTGDAWRLLLRDRQSTNGTKRNGTALVPHVDYALADGDLVVLGRTAIRVTMVGAKHATAAANGSDDVRRPQEHRQSQQRDKRPETESAIESRVERVAAVTHKSETRETCVDLAMVDGDQNDDDEDDVFEAPRPRPPRTRPPPPPSAAAAAAAAATTTAGTTETTTTITRAPTPTVDETACVVCHNDLGCLTVLERQLHVNACLDGRSTTQTATTTTGGNNATSSGAKSKKRKRSSQAQQRTLAQDPELAMAVALSKSLTDPEQQVDMNIALVTSELAQVTQQLAKLEKKRAALVKKLTRLEKTKNKLRKPRVRPPEELRVLLDLERAVNSLFGRDRGQITESDDDVLLSDDKRHRQSRCVGRFTAARLIRHAEESTAAMSMWRRAAQHPDHDEDALYRTRLLDRFESTVQVDTTSATTLTADNGNEVVDVTEEPTVRDEETKQQQGAVSGDPPSRTEEVHQEEEEEVVILDHLNTAASTTGTGEMDAVMDECDVLIVDSASPLPDVTPASTDQAATREPPSTTPPIDLSAAFGITIDDVPEVVKTVFPRWHENLGFLQCQDITDLQDALEEMRRMRVERLGPGDDNENDDECEDNPQFATGIEHDEDLACVFFEQMILRLIVAKTPMPPPLHAESEPHVIALLDSDEDDAKNDEDQVVEPEPQPEPPVVSNGEEHEEQEEHESTRQQNLESEVSSSPSPSPPVLMASQSPIPDLEKTTAIDDNGKHDNDLETQLLTALRANAELYEAVLLLQPVEFSRLHAYITGEAGLRCPKTQLAAFCDRHGISFR